MVNVFESKFLFWYDINMNYIDTVLWLPLEILDIFNSTANKILIINSSN